MIGSWGPIAFEVSADRVRTFDDLQRTTRVRWGKHDVIGQKQALEFGGVDAAAVSMMLRFRYTEGLIPHAEIRRLREIAEAGEAHPLFIGDENLGVFVIEQIQEAREEHTPKGRLLAVSAAVSFLEYSGGGDGY